MERFKLHTTSFLQQEEMHRLLQRKEEERCYLEREIFELQQMREEMINDQRDCVLWKEVFSDVLGRTSKTFQYPLKAPFTHVEEKIEGRGYFNRQLVNPAEGLYQVTYVSDFQLGNPFFWGSGSVVGSVVGAIVAGGSLWTASASDLSNSASVTIYGKYNQQPEIKQKIQQTEVAQQEKKCRHDILINDISALRRGLEEVIKRQTINQQEEVIRQQEKMIGNFQKQKTLLENSYQLTKDIFDQNQSLYDQQEKLFGMLVPLADQSDREVMSVSYSMLQELKVMQQAHEERNSFNPTFIEPKQTRCGHLFNCPEITEWLMGNQFCPVCRTPTTLEEITSVSLSLF
jgi:hypothetical protein